MWPRPRRPLAQPPRTVVYRSTDTAVHGRAGRHPGRSVSTLPALCALGSLLSVGRGHPAHADVRGPGS